MIAGPLLYLMNPRLIVITPSPRRSLTPVTLALIALLGVSFTQAQIAPAPKPEVANATVTLTPFTVSAEKDVGFVAASSLAGGRIAPVIDSIFDLADAAAPHRRLETSQHIGRIILRVA